MGAVLTGVIGLFILIACAATLHQRGISITDASDAARAREPLAAAIVPLSTAYSVSEAFAAPADVNNTPKEAPLFYTASSRWLSSPRRWS